MYYKIILAIFLHVHKIVDCDISGIGWWIYSMPFNIRAQRERNRRICSLFLFKAASLDYFQVGRPSRWWWRCLLSLHRLNWFISERVQESRYRGRWLASVEKGPSSGQDDQPREDLSFFPRSSPPFEPFLRSYPRKARQLRIIITVFRLLISGYRSSGQMKKKETRCDPRAYNYNVPVAVTKSSRLIMAQFSPGVVIRTISSGRTLLLARVFSCDSAFWWLGNRRELLVAPKDRTTLFAIEFKAVSRTFF